MAAPRLRVGRTDGKDSLTNKVTDKIGKRKENDSEYKSRGEQEEIAGTWIFND